MSDQVGSPEGMFSFDMAHNKTCIHVKKISNYLGLISCQNTQDLSYRTYHNTIYEIISMIQVDINSKVQEVILK